MDKRLQLGLAVGPLALCPTLATAQTGAYIGELAAGFLHPASQLDHVVAITAVGLRGGVLGAPAL